MKDITGIKNVLVTGAAGKIGRNTIPLLLEEGYYVRAVQFNDIPVTIKHPHLEIFNGDVSDESFAPRAIQDIDAVIHLAHVKENREKFLKTTVCGTFWLLDAVKNYGGIKQYIQAGSDARAGIFYYPQPVMIDESHRHSAYPGYYAFTKVIEEVMCEQYIIQYSLPVTILRFSWVMDEDDVLAHVTLKEPDFGVPVWKELASTPEQKAYFEKGEDGVAMLCHPDGKPGIRQVVGIKDVASSIMLALGNGGSLGKAFNISGPAPFSYSIMAEYAGRKLGLPVVPFTYDSFYDFSISVSLARSVLGYDPKYDIFAIIDDAVKYREEKKARTPMLYVG